MTTFEIVSLAIQLISAGFVFAGLLYTGKQISLLKRTHRENHDWNRRIETQKALAEYNRTIIAPDLNKVFDHLNAKHPISVEKVLAEFATNSSLQSQCHILLNSYEGFARGIQQGIYDEEIIRKARKTAIIRTYTAYKEYIAHRQRENNSLAFKELEALVSKWLASNDNESTRKQLGKM